MPKLSSLLSKKNPMQKSAYISTLILLVLFVSACRETPFDPIEQSRTYLNILNAYGPTDKVDVYLRSYESDGLFAGNVDFMESWPNGGYASMITTSGFDSLEKEPDTWLRVLERSTGNTIIPEEGFRLNPEVRASVVLIDSFGKAKIVKTIDVFESPGDTAANVRFMNVNYTMASVSLRTSDDSTLNIERLNFLNYSKFSQIPPGTYDFEFVFDQTASVVTSLPAMRIEAGRTYSFFLTQQGGAPQVGVERLD